MRWTSSTSGEGAVIDRKIAIVGTGLVGRAWAIAFARGGCRVALFDPAEGQAAAALELIRGALDDLADASSSHFGLKG